MATKLVGRSARSGDRLDLAEYTRDGVAAWLVGEQVHIVGAKELTQLWPEGGVMVVALSNFDYVVPW